MVKISTIKAPEVSNYIVDWLREYATNAKVNGFVVGISGGIDSAVTSSLCARTGFSTLCVEMPIHQAQSHVSRGREHIAQLKSEFPNVDSATADLTPAFEAFRNAVPNTSDQPAIELALANSRARLRMTALYYFAGIRGLLVAGTGNKIEDFGVGFFTKYGDGGVDLSPIADLMKSDVRALAEYLGVPASIVDAAPTDGLFGDYRTDETQLGASYDELEWAMLEAQNGKKIDDFTGREKSVFAIYRSRNRANQHKMNAIPVCLIPGHLKKI